MEKLQKESLELIAYIKKTTGKSGWARHDLEGVVSTSKNYFGGDLILKKQREDYIIEIRCNGGTKVIDKWDSDLKSLEKIFELVETWMKNNKVTYEQY